MTRIPIALFLAAAVLPAAAQVQSPQAQPPGQPEGFFRPTEDPALTRWGAQAPAQGGNGGAAAAQSAQQVEAEDFAAMQAAIALREAQALELERAEREHATAQAIIAARTPPPAIVSPLDGSAAIIDPLDR